MPTPENSGRAKLTTEHKGNGRTIHEFSIKTTTALRSSAAIGVSEARTPCKPPSNIPLSTTVLGDLSEAGLEFGHGIEINNILRKTVVHLHHGEDRVPIQRRPVHAFRDVSIDFLIMPRRARITHREEVDDGLVTLSEDTLMEKA